MKPSCINFIVCVISEVFRNEFRKYILYVQCVYLCILYFTCDVLNSFRNRFCEAQPVNLECRFLTRDFYPFFFFSILLYSLLQVTLLIANFWHLSPSEGFRGRSQRPFDRAQLLYVQQLQTGQTVGVRFGKTYLVFNMICYLSNILILLFKLMI